MPIVLHVICSSCGTANEPGRKFCGECGTRLAVACPACGAANAPGVKFCGECGTRLAEASAASGAAQAAHAGPGSGASPVAERRLVSILFADLVGFTPLAEDRDAEEVREFLSRYFDTCREVIDRYGGTVEKFIGDAVMAVWGTPTAHEDDAERAVRAGLELVSAVGRLRPSADAGADAADAGADAADAGADAAGGQQLTVQLRAAVLTGEAAVSIGAVGEGLVAGDLVNTASRLQSVAPPGTVLVGEATQRAASGGISFEQVGEQLLKGKAAPIPAWRAVKVVAGRGGKGRTEGPEPPFVGRDDELRLLKDLYHATAREGRSRLVSIVGEAGIGKSRLAWELEKYLDGLVEQVWWHAGRSPAYGEGVTFWALSEMVRQRAGIAETDDPATTRAGLAEMLGQHVPDADERRWVERRLAALLGLEEMPRGEREELFAAWRTLFQRLAAQGPTVMVFEDIQWADHGLVDFIEYLLAGGRGDSILIVTLARPELFERRPNWGAGQPSFTGMQLEPLSSAEMEQLLEGFVPGLPSTARATIVERAAGIPLYAVETVRMLIDGGQLRRDGDRYSVEGELSRLAVPETLQALIGARLDALPPEQRSLLQDAAVLGQSFTLAALAGMSGREPTQLEGLVEPLVARQLLLVERDPRSPERGQYKFTQGVVREVAYQTLSRRDRRERHLAAARFYESLGEEELSGVLASHYLDAYRSTAAGPEADALAAQARVSLKAAAERASTLHSYRQALAYLEQAIEVAGDDVDRAATHLHAAELALAAAENDSVEHHVSQAAGLYERLGDRPGLARVRALDAQYSVNTRGYAAVIPVLESSLAEFADLGDDPSVIRIRAELARVYMLEDRSEEAAAMSEQVLQAAGPLELTDVIAEALITRGPAIAALGRWHEGMALLRGAVHLAEQNRHYNSALRAQNNLASLAAYDSVREAALSYEQALELARRLGLHGWHLQFIGGIGNVAILAGGWDRWFGLLEEVDPEPAGYVDWFESIQGTIVALRGDLAGGEDLVGRHEQRLRDQGAMPAAFVEWAVSMRRLAAGDLHGAFESATRATPNVNMLLEGTITALRAAAWLRDADRIRTTLEHLAAHRQWTGQMRAVVERYGQGVTLALERRPDAARSELLAAIDGLEQTGVGVMAALTRMELPGLLGSGDAELEAIAAEGRAFLEREGASALIAQVEALPPVNRSNPKAPTPSTTAMESTVK